MRDGNAGARVERQLLVQLFVAAALQRIALRLVDLFDRLHREIADGEAAHLARRRHVAIEQRRRRRQYRGDVVEAVAGVVDRQPFAGPHVDREEIANRVAVLGAVQAVHERAAGIRMLDRGAIERRFEKCDERSRAFGIGPRADRRRRHLTRAQLPRDFFPDLRMRRNVGEREVLQREPGGLEPIVVARHAVRVDEAGVFLRRRKRAHGWRWRLQV